MTPIEIKANGTVHTLPPQATIPDLLRTMDIEPDMTGIAVAHNWQVVPRQNWPQTHLNDGDELEVITASQGG